MILISIREKIIIKDELQLALYYVYDRLIDRVFILFKNEKKINFISFFLYLY
jgi:hypothetical protein